MSSLLGSFFGEETGQSVDETIVANGIASSATSANAYLNATLEATTPEVRRIFGEYTTQNVTAHEALKNLAIQKEWISPYASPQQQLQTSYKQSQSTLSGRH